MSSMPLSDRFFVRVVFFLLILNSPSIGGEPSNSVEPIPSSHVEALSNKPHTPSARFKPAKGSVSLGIAVEKPGAALYAQLPELAPGSGFLLKSVQEGSPALVAGLKPMDVMVSLNGQLLINENQLMTLLAMYSPGDKVEVSYFRSGEKNKAVIILQQRSEVVSISAHDAFSLPFQASLPGFPPRSQKGEEQGEQLHPFPLRVISYEDRSASISDRFGTATLMLREGKPWLHVESVKGVETFNGSVAETAEIARVPVVWRSRLPVLQRSLEESVRLRHMPRMRYVPKQKQQFAENK